MIIEAVVNIVKSLLFTLLGVINIPNFPEVLTNSIDTFVDLIFDNLGLITLFVRWETIVIGIPLLIVVMNFEHFYNGIIWILKKIPFLGMS